MKKSTKLLMVAMIIVILAASIGGTLAYIVTSTKPVENTFTPEQVTCEIYEDFNGTEKTSITVKNTSNISVYIRVALIPYWVDGEDSTKVAGIASWTVPTFTMNDGWIKGDDGYYYYTEPVNPGEFTPSLVNGSIELPADQDGNKAALTIAAEAIQSQGGAVTVSKEKGWDITDPSAE